MSSYEERVQQMVEKAKEIEKNWLAQDPTNKDLPNPSYVFTTYDYMGMGWRPAPSFYYYDLCPRCKAANMFYQSISAGCRHNGDGYGSELYYCQTCGAIDFTSYDEA